MDYDFRMLQPSEVVARWSELRELLDRAVVHGKGELAVDDIVELVLSGRMIVSVLEQGNALKLVVVAEIKFYPRKKVLNLAYAAGSNVEVVAKHFMENLTEMARILKADSIRCYCRESVARLLKRYRPNVKQIYIVLEEQLDEDIQ